MTAWVALVAAACLTTQGQNPTCPRPDDSFTSLLPSEAEVYALTPAPEGGILISGSFEAYGGQTRSSVARLLANGALDPAFDPGEGFDGDVYALALLPDGDLIAGGDFLSCDGFPCGSLARLHPDGSVDTTFAADIAGYVNTVVVDAAERILVGGSWETINGNSRVQGLARLTATGGLDPTFASQIPAGLEPYALAVQPDGRILVGGADEVQDATSRSGLVRLLPDGAADRSFFPITVLVHDDLRVNTLVIADSGSILVGGAFELPGETTRETLVHLDATGRLDPSFRPAFASETGWLEVTSMVRDAEGNLTVAGAFQTVNGLPRHGLVRLNPNGGVLPGFDPGDGIDDPGIIWTQAIQPDGGLLIGGYFSGFAGIPRQSLARLVCSGAPPSKPVIVVAPAGGSALQGASFSFTVEADGTPPLTYQWFFNGQPIPGATTPVLTLEDVQPSDVGSYSVSVANSVGETVSQAVALAVLSVPVPPIIEVEPVDLAILAGQDALFAVQATGTAPLSYQWLKDGEPIPGAQSTTLLIQDAQPSDEGGYSVVVTNAAGTTVSREATLVVLDPQAGFEVTDFTWQGGAEGTLRFPAEPGFYYVLLQGVTVTAIVEPVAVYRPETAGDFEVRVPLVADAGSSVFLRLLRVPVSAPLDQDRDGIDDLFELAHPGLLNPVDGNDARLDGDGDWLTNLDEYLLGTSLSEETFLNEPVSLEVVLDDPTGEPAARSLAAEPGVAAVVRAHIPEAFTGVVAVGFYVDDRLKATLTQPPFEWQPTDLSPGVHMLRVKARLRDGSAVSSDNVQHLVPLPPGEITSGATAPTTLAVGVQHALAIADDGTLWAWGSNYNGQLGLGSTGIAASVPTQVSTFTDWLSVAAGGETSLAVRRDGSLWSAGGLDPNGQLPRFGSASFVRVGTDSDWAQVFLSSIPNGNGPLPIDTRYAVKRDGSLWVWGNWIPAPFGLGAAMLEQPELLPLPARCVDVSESGWTSQWVSDLQPLLVLDDGGIYVFADGHAVPALDSGDWKVAEWGFGSGAGIKHDGSLWRLVPNERTESPFFDAVQIGTETDWASVDTNPAGILFALRTDGSLWRWASMPGLPNQLLMALTETPEPAEGGTDWLVFQIGLEKGFGIRRDGSLWEMNKAYNCGTGNPLQWPVRLVRVPFNQPLARPSYSKPFLTSTDDTPVPRAKDATGNLPVQFAVDSTGAATFSVPIAVPPGTAGMEPGLAVTYHSRGGNGLLGMGASLSGLSTITRCGKTIAQDGVTGGVRFDANDRYCLDGQRLVPVNGGADGGDGTEYRTEIESFTRVRSYGHAGSGPASWKVWTKSGQILEFGNTPDSRIEGQGSPEVMLWAVNRIEDVRGNYLTVSYHEDNALGEYTPNRIAYTGNDQAGTAPFAAVEFLYGSRPDLVKGRVGPFPVTVSRLLKGIRTSVQGNPVFTYTFLYEEGHATGRSRLNSVTLCNADGTCFPPTRFDQWTDFDTELFFAIQDKFLPGTKYWADAGDYRYLTGDFNGDGKSDLLHLPDDNHYNVWLSDSGGRFNVAGFTQDGVGDYHKDKEDHFYFVAGDFNGDGRTDFFHPRRDNKAELWRATPAGRFSISDCTPAGYGDILQNGDKGHLRYYAGDWNGDGRTDLFHVVNPSTVKVWLSRGDGTFRFLTESIAPEESYRPTENDDNYLVFDVNGDGLTDLLHIKERDQYWLWTSLGNGHFDRQSHAPDYDLDLRANDSDFRTGDFDGNGRTDLIHFAGSDSLYVWMSLGDGRFNVIPQTASTFYLGCGSSGGVLNADYDFKGKDPGRYDENAYKFSIADFNGDGRTDLIHFFSNTDAFLWISRGDGSFKVTRPFDNSSDDPYGLMGEGGFRYQVGDFDGDGRSDLVHFVDRQGIHVWKAQGQDQERYPDLLGRITDGQGNTTEVSYQPLTDAPFYTSGTDAAYPVQDLHGPLYVVESQRLSDGQGGLYELLHHYSGGRADISGRGFLGFATTEVEDARNHLHTVTRYRQDFPYNGQVKESRLIEGDGTTLNHTLNTWNSRTFTGPGPDRFFVYNDSSVANAYELNGSLITSVTTTTSFSGDDYGNPTRIIVDSGDGYRKTTVNTYQNDPGRWLLGRLTRAAVTSDAPGQNAQTRTSAFTYDSDGLLASEVIEPDHPKLRLQTDYAHDRFGNRSRVTVSGNGIATRTSGTAYDSLGRFPVRMTNALDHVERLGSDGRFGVVTNAVDANGLTTAWKYDGFGRKLRETRADGTTTTLTYAKRDANAPPRATYLLRTKESGRAPSTAYLDKLGRTLRVATEGLDGRLVFQDNEYDEFGRTKRTSRSYFQGETPQWTKFTYDVLGRVRTETLPDDSVSTTKYEGRVITATDPLNHVAIQTRDSQGQLLQVENDAHSVIHYEYDPFGNLTRTTAPGNVVTTIDYDLRGRKTSMVDPDMGTWAYTNNVLGELIGQRDAKGQGVSFEYDKLGRLTRRVEAEGETRWTYDTAAHGVGRLARVNGPGGYTRVHAYDPLSRPANHTITFEGQDYTFGATYDAFSHVATTRFPSGVSLRNEYNARSYLVSTFNETADQEVWRLKAMNAAGQTTRETLGNGVTTTRAYDPERGWIDTIVTGTDGSIQNLEYEFNDLGNLRWRTDHRQGLLERFTYDNLSRLTNAVIDGRAALTCDYNRRGGITFKSDVGGYEYAGNGGGPNAVSRAGGVDYFYDSNGNQTSGGGRTITYTSFNKPLLISKGTATSAFTYDPDHARIKQVATVGGATTTTLYLGGAYEIERRGTARTEKHYLGSAVYTREFNGETLTATRTRYLHGDHLSSTDTVTDDTGAVIERFSYDPFGKRRDEAWNNIPSGTLRSDVTERAFTGHLQLDALDVIHMGGRSYDPVLGRMLSADPLIQSPGNLQSHNRYSYVLNNPLTLTDPTGYFSFGNVQHFFREHGRTAGAIAAGMAATAISGGLGAPSLIAAGLGGATQGAVASRGDLRSTLVSAGTSIAFQAVDNAFQYHKIAQPYTALPQQPGGFSAVDASRGFHVKNYLFGSAGADIFVRSAAHGLVGGLSASIQGGSFRTSFLFSAGGGLGKGIYETYVGASATFRLGREIHDEGYDTGSMIAAGVRIGPTTTGSRFLDLIFFGTDTVGFQVRLPNDVWGRALPEGGWLASSLQFAVPGINSISKFHDFLVDYYDWAARGLVSDATSIIGLLPNQAFNIPTMPLAGAVTYSALLAGNPAVEIARRR
ncbi:MAG: VCBS repeat-containing protein [Verrucomicrobiales bacterium]|nr:VCBS repeat-containing protein [Verrucomicrobiales bacterium]